MALIGTFGYRDRIAQAWREFRFVRLVLPKDVPVLIEGYLLGDFPARRVAGLNISSQRTYVYVDSQSLLKEVVSRLTQAGRVAIDTEADSLYHYYEKVCLIQLSFNGEHYLIDPLSSINLSTLFDVLADKRLVLHGAEYDLRMLRAMADFLPQKPLFDTAIAARLLGYTHFSLASLIEQHYSVTLGKKGQKSDWSHRPLTEAQLEYAVDDTRYLEGLAGILSNELEGLSRTQWHEESCQQMLAATQQENSRSPDKAWRIKGIRHLTRRQLAVVRQVWLWRDEQARQADRPPFKILGNRTIIELALAAGTNGVGHFECYPKLPVTCKGKRLEALQLAVDTARRIPESDWPEHTAHYQPREISPCFEPLRTEITHLANELKLDPAVVANRKALESIALAKPGTIEQIVECGSLMQWQAKLVLPAVRKVLG